MPRHFFRLWNSPKTYNKRDSSVEHKIEDMIQSIKFKLWFIFRR